MKTIKIIVDGKEIEATISEQDLEKIVGWAPEMTIDRLEELHTLTGQFAKAAIDAGFDSTAVDFAADIRSLIDAEIARQSVGDEEIDEVIKNFESFLDYITDENRLQKYRDHYGGELPTYKLEEIRDVKVAIYALRAYQKLELYCPKCGRKLEVF